MNRRLTLFTVSIIFLSTFLTANAQKPVPGTELIERLLSLPALPPPNPYDRPPRNPEFFDPMKPPPDDAPIEDLLEYWAVQSKADPKFRFAVTPSPTVARRILEAVSKTPGEIPRFLTALRSNPEAVEAVKRMYDTVVNDEDARKDSAASMRKWLEYNSPYFGSELAARAAKAHDEEEYLTNQDEVLALMRTNWDLAEPLLSRFYSNSSQPITQTLARWAYYEHAIRTDDQLGISRWREELKSVVEDKSAPIGGRDLAMDALVESGDFEGRDEWYMTLLEDETLLNVIVGGREFTGLTTIMNHSPAGKFDDRMIELVRTTSSKTVRSAALRNLANSGGLEREDAVKAALKWLADPQWATDIRFSRVILTKALQKVRLPDAGPALLAYLSELRAAKSDYLRKTKEPTRWNRELLVFDVSIAEAGHALGNQGEPRAAQPLREVLSELPEQYRSEIVKAMLRCGSFSVPELVQAVETRARTNAASAMEFSQQRSVPSVFSDSNEVNANPDGELEIVAPRPIISEGRGNGIGRGTGYGRSEDNAAVNGYKVEPLNMNRVRRDLENLLDAQYEPSDDLLRAAIERAETLNRTEPTVAAEMRAILGKWTGRAVNQFLIRSLAAGTSGLKETLSILTRRNEIRENQATELGELNDGVPTGGGIAACIVEQNAAYDAILDGENETAKAAMLACARLIRAKLPVTNVAALIPSKNKLLSVAAQKYLIAEDSPAARKIIFDTYPNKAIVLGARFGFDDSDGYDPELVALFKTVQYWPLSSQDHIAPTPKELDDIQKKLRAEVLGDESLIGVYAFANNFVRMYRNRAVFSWEDDPARYRYRTLEPEELERIQTFVTDKNLAELPPFLSGCEESCSGSEFLMLGKAGGQRVFVGSSGNAPFVEGLEKILSEFRSKPSRIRYAAQDAVKGLDVFYESDAKSALAVWHQNGELRVLLADPEERRAAAKELKRASAEARNNPNVPINREAFFAKIAPLINRGFDWFSVKKGALGARTERPEGLTIPPAAEEDYDPNATDQWKWKAASLSLRVDRNGINKVVSGVVTPVIKGAYEFVVVSDDGRWIVARRLASKAEMANGEYGNKIVRIDSATGAELALPFDETEGKRPVAYFAPLGKFLLIQAFGRDTLLQDADNSTRLGEYLDSLRYVEAAWLDPKTGIITPVTQDIRPIADQSFRPLQAVRGRAGEFWAAISDRAKDQAEIGIYDSKTMRFKPMVALPKIRLKSMMIWVDEPAKLCYFTYGGQVLSVPVNW